MAESFRLDPSGLETANSEFLGTGNTLGDAYDNLILVLDDHHGCWGDDDIGKAFAKNYVTSADEVRTAAKECVDGMHELHEGVTESLETFQSVDEESAIEIDKSVTGQ
jgi:hypothetical protein